MSETLGLLATAYGLVASLTVLLQARTLLRTRRSCDVSAGFFTSYVVGYLVWLAYGVSIGSWPLILVDAAGVLCGGATLVVILVMRRACAQHEHDVTLAA